MARRDSGKPRTPRGSKRNVRPLRRKPQALTQDPTLHDAAAATGSGGPMSVARKNRQVGAAAASAGKVPDGSSLTTDEQGELVSVAAETPADPEILSLSRRIAARLSVPRPRAEPTGRRGQGRQASLPYRGAADEIDLDATIEMLAGKPVPEDHDIIVRDRVKAARAVVLIVDVSGSMRGERIRTAAATVGALAGELAQDQLAVIAFWSDAAIVSRLSDPVRPDRLLHTLAGIPTRGLTNVAFPLEVAARQLSSTPPQDARVILLSDCVHNAGPDPRPFAAALPRLDVLLDVSGEQDVELGRELASAGHGILRLARSHHDVGPAISEMFSAS